MTETIDEADILELATELTIAWLSNPNTRSSVEDATSFLKTVHGALANLTPTQRVDEQTSALPAEFERAVTVRKSLASKDHIVSMIDGKPYKALRRHLGSHGLTPEQYRQRYSLKPDYPMVAEGYSEVRRAMAKKIGLGRKPKTAIAPKKTPRPRAKKQRETAPA